MLPIMVIAFVAMFIALFRKMRKLNTLVSDILLDPSGQELTFVFRNQFLRKLRNDKTEVTIPITSLINPPQGENYQKFTAEPFPEKYPFDFRELIKGDAIWFKYYISQRTFFAIYKHAQYKNFELLCNAFAQKIINLEEIPIFEIQSNKMTDKELVDFLKHQDLYHPSKFVLRYY
jgi:hypothetical protein